MQLSINQLKPEDIQVFDDGFSKRPEGIKFGNVDVWLSDRCLDALSVVVTMLQTERAMRDAERERDETRDCENQTGDWAGASTVGLPQFKGAA